MKEKAQNKKTHFELFSVLVIVATLFMSVAFADVSDINLVINGTITPQIQYGIYIEDISVKSKTGVISEAVKYYQGTNLSTSIELASATTSSLIYNITLYNNQDEAEAYFAGVTYADEAYSNKNITYSIEGIEPYVTTIHARERISFTLEFKCADGTTASSTQELNSLLKFNFSNEFIEFVVGSYKFSAPKGATWEQFNESEYNAGITITNGKVYVLNKQVYILDKEVKSTDLIVEGQKYNYKPEITLDKESIAVKINDGETVTQNITATLTNVEGDLTWKSSNTEVAEVVANGNTATLTLKAAGTATITVSYGTISKTCTITVTEKKIQIGSYVEYNIPYIDMYSKLQYTSTNGWRYLGTDDDGNHLIVSTAIPAIYWYSSGDYYMNLYPGFENITYTYVVPDQDSSNSEAANKAIHYGMNNVTHRI